MAKSVGQKFARTIRMMRVLGEVGSEAGAIQVVHKHRRSRQGEAIPMQQMTGQDEWLALMTELAALDRDSFRELRAEAWERVVRGHGEKDAKQIAEWKRNAS